MRQTIRRSLLFVPLLWSSLTASDGQPAAIPVLVYDRPPLFVVGGQGAVSGLMAEPTQAVFEAAGIPFQWRVVSPKAALVQVEQNAEPLCTAGWFKTADRELYAKYTLAVRQDSERGVLYRADDSRIPAHDTFTGLLADGALTVGLKKSYTYGKALDALLVKLTPKSVLTDQVDEGMIRMLLGGRFDYMMLNREQAEYLKNLPEFAGKAAIRGMRDVAPGDLRHILCTRQTPDEMLRALNAAIKRLGLPTPLSERFGSDPWP